MAMLLGYVDEIITEHYASQVDYSTNKLGGHPNWIDERSKTKVICKVCGSVVPMLLQVYAPVEERPRHHRTLYIFACINPNCWGNSQSWICLKHQTPMKEEVAAASFFSDDDWGMNADNWDLDDQGSSSQTSFGVDEVASMIENVSVLEENANEVPQYGATEMKNICASAIIEPDENEPISLDTPESPSYNLIEMVKQKPSSLKISNENIHFIPAFVNAAEEKFDKDPLMEHAQSLLSNYTLQNGNAKDLKLTKNLNVCQGSDESYEKSLPAHGDKLFYAFVSRVKMNPEQILRYNRIRRDNTKALFLYPESSIPQECRHCRGPMAFEMQILPTILNHLQLFNTNRNDEDLLEFGTVLIYTCRGSCDRSTEECIVVQQEKI